MAVSFLCHFPSAFAAWDFPSVLPCGVRTFLAPEGPRSPGLHAHGSAAPAERPSGGTPYGGVRIAHPTKEEP